MPDRAPIPRARLMLGTAGFGDWIPERMARAIVEAALALGIRRFDTAASYGRSEDILGRALASHGTTALVATKVSPEVDLNLRRPLRAQIFALAERSLARLRRDRIDLLQLHDPLPPSLIGDALDAFAALRERGVIGALGLCNHDVPALIALLDRLPGGTGLAPVLLQNRHNRLASDLPPGLTALCSARGLAVWAWSPLAGGLLAGRYGSDDPRPAGSRAARGRWLPVEDVAPFLPVLDGLKARHGPDPARAALDWVLASPGVAGAILGPSRPAHLDIVGPPGPAVADQDLAATRIW